MNASVQVVTMKWVFRYIQEPTWSTHPVFSAHDCSDGSTKTCRARSSETMSRACSKAAADWSQTCPRTSR